MMKALVLNNCGIESFVISELCSLLSITEKELNATPYSGAVVFEHESFEQLFTYCYLGQSPSKVLSLVGSFSLTDFKLDDLLEQIKKLDFVFWLDSSTSLAVRTDLEPKDSSRRETEAEIGAVIVKVTHCKVNLSKPDVLIYVTSRDGTVFVAVDLCEADLAKRDYRIFTGRVNIKAPVAAFACYKAQINEGEIVIDPFCKNGTVVLECAHSLLHRSVHFFHKDKFLFTRMPKFSTLDFDEFLDGLDEKQLKKIPHELYAIDANFRHISAIKKNAKIAGVDKMISYSRTSPDWIDTKFDKEQVHHIICFVPQFSKTFAVKEIEKHLQELFYQASFVLAPSGNVVCISRETKVLGEYAEKYKFSKSFEQEIKQGDVSFFVAVFVKNSSD